jgi:hypothetical protein
MAHAQKPDFVFRRNGWVHLNRQGHQFSRLLAAEVCASAVVMLDTPCSEEVRRVLATHSIRLFPLHFPSRASPCAITFQLGSAIASFWGKLTKAKIFKFIWHVPVPELRQLAYLERNSEKFLIVKAFLVLLLLLLLLFFWWGGLKVKVKFPVWTSWGYRG